MAWGEMGWYVGWGRGNIKESGTFNLPGPKLFENKDNTV